MNSETKNIILATCLSILVVIAWEYFVTGPQFEKDRHAQTQLHVRQSTAGPSSGATSENDKSPSTSAPAPAVEAAPQINREEALAESPRIKLQPPAISGSIALRGARIDDVSLNDYRETVDPKSPNIILLSPSGSPASYYVEIGFIADPDSNLVLPGPNTLWQADQDELTDSKPVALTYDNGQGLIFHRTFAIDDHYMFTVTDSVENKSTQPVTLHPSARVVRHGKPPSTGYSSVHEGFVGVIGDSSAQTKWDQIEKEDHRTKTFSGTGGWIGLTDKYWGAVVIPDQSKAVEASFTETNDLVPNYLSGYVVTEGLSLAPNTSGAVTSRVFTGAKVSDLLDHYRNDLGIKKFDLLIDWGRLYLLTKPMFRLLDFIYKFVGNFGVAILCVTVLVRGLFFPLANKSYAAMAEMKKIQPEMQAIRDRFPDDKQKQQMEIMALYKRKKINPLAGCLPVAVQIPVFISLYNVLVIAIEMRQAPFFGWIKDLSRPDPTNVFNLFGLIPFDPTQVPVFGAYLAIGAWPVIMGISMFIQMKVNPEPTDPIQKQVFTWMPILFTFTLGTFASGLVIYWSWSNMLSVIQQTTIMKRHGAKIELWDNLVGLFRKKATT
ncbi:MAG: membrane protein insertase YidC [Alphaproteobacteria bacterium]|nr:membrane protein insertase YidC [Alphaproteobacteria bacterium]